MKRPYAAAVFLPALLLTIFAAAWLAPTVRGEVVRVEIIERRPFADGKSFGRSGPYETIRGRLHFEVDPDAPANGRIADLKFAPRNDRGRVESWSDFFLLKPVDPQRGNRAILYDVDNRGNKLALWTFNGGERTNTPSTAEHAGDGLLMRQGYSLLWCGWNGDVMEDGTDRLLVGLPVARRDGGPITGRVHLEFSVDEPVKSRVFGWSPWGTADAYPTGGGALPGDLDDRSATLTMRPSRAAPALEVARDQWAFARWEEGRVIPDPRSLYLREGLRPGWLYDLVYTASNPRVAGLGLAAVRDAVSFFRHAADDGHGTKNPLAGNIERAYIFGISQSGRMVNQFIYDGFNTDPGNRMVFEGAIAHVAGAGRGLFNHRFGLATLFATQHRDNLVPSEAFPFTATPQRDPIAGIEGDILEAARAAGSVPKIFFVQTSTEYWSRGASLLHTDVDGERDVEPDSSTRIYLVAGAQHLGGGPPTRGIGQNPRNILDDRPPILRGLLAAMDQWVREDREPPSNRIPRIADGTLVALEAFAFPAIPGVAAPSVVYEPLRLDFGPRWRGEGIADIVPPKIGSPYRTLVPMVDADGNELAGIRLPDVAVPLGTFTGWNLRAAAHGAEGMLAGLDGSYLAFARTAAEARQSGDPRPAVLERYPTREAYLARFVEAALSLQGEGFLLPEDALKLIRTAAERDLWNDPPSAP